MNDILLHTAKLVKDFNDSIIKDLDTKRITNTGKAKQSLRVEVGLTNVRSLGIDYLLYLDQGRSSGKFPPVLKITEWVREKLKISNSRELKQVSYLVGRKISKEGTEIFKNKSKGIELDKKIDVLKFRIRTDIPTTMKAVFLDSLRKKQPINL